MPNLPLAPLNSHRSSPRNQPAPYYIPRGSQSKENIAPHHAAPNRRPASARWLASENPANIGITISYRPSSSEQSSLPTSPGPAAGSTTGDGSSKNAEVQDHPRDTEGQNSQPYAGNVGVYLVSIGFVYKKVVEKSGRSKAAEVKDVVNKKEHMQLSTTTTRCDFITNCLKVHSLQDAYAPGPVSGPRFKIWWTRSPGGKSGATQVDTDHNWEVERMSILANQGKTEILVEYDLSSMDGYRPDGPSSFNAASNSHSELLHGAQVPQTSMFTPEEQLHGAIVLQIKQRWTCNTHMGESGGPGLCYVMPVTGEHFGLNNMKLKQWAAAIASRQYTVNGPPTQVLDGGSRDAPSGKARGRIGPHPATALNAGTSAPNDLLSLMASTLIPVAAMAIERMTASAHGGLGQPAASGRVVDIAPHPPVAAVET
ncbi:hypothetical protein BC835DRAFT_1337223, partial [Cytidiella melzeri]